MLLMLPLNGKLMVFHKYVQMDCCQRAFFSLISWVWNRWSVHSVRLQTGTPTCLGVGVSFFVYLFIYLLSMPFSYFAHSSFCSVIASLFQTTPVWPSYFSQSGAQSFIHLSLLSFWLSAHSVPPLVCCSTIAGFILTPFLSLAHLLNLSAFSLVSVLFWCLSLALSVSVLSFCSLSVYK